MAKIPVKEATPKEEVSPKTYENNVMQALFERGFNKACCETIITKHLWANNYRVNCYKNNKIAYSFFIRYSLDEGILFCDPEIKP